MVIAYVISLAFLLFISLFLFVGAGWVMKVLGKIIHVISWPVRKLWDLINRLMDKGIEVTIGNKRFYAFGGFKGFLMFVCLILFAVIAAISVLNYVVDLETLVFAIMDNTMLGACILLLKNIGSENANQITAAVLFAAGFSAGISALCSKPFEDAKGYIRFIAGAISLVVMIALTIILEGVFESAGNWCYNTFMSLTEQSGGGIFKSFGRIVALIVFGYLAILAFLLIIEQYASFVAVIPIALFAYGIVSYGVNGILTLVNAADAVLIASGLILTVVIFVIVEVMRNKYDMFEKYAKIILGKIFGGRKGKTPKTEDATF